MTDRTADPAALVISYSEIESDPRVRRQIDWLTAAGYQVDTLGLGGQPSPTVRTHFKIGDVSRWATTRLGTAVVHFLLPARVQFRILATDRVPRELIRRLRSEWYAVVVFNEYEFAPWASDRRLFDPSHTRLHLDMHEFREPGRRGRSRWARITRRHYRWVRRHIGSSAFSSRSTVARGIAAQYEKEFEIDAMWIVRSIPDLVEQRPSPVDPDRIRLLYHGMAGWSRGLPEIVEALVGLDERFHMTFMLTQPQSQIDRLRGLLAESGVADRASIVPPVPMREIAEKINEYDLEIIFFPPATINIQFALPNKIFEAIQGRLGLVIGPSPMLLDIVEQYGNGIIAAGWAPEDLRAALAALSDVDVRRLKDASDVAAQDLNAENEGKAFLTALGLS